MRLLPLYALFAVNPLIHASVEIVLDETVIQVDPWSAGDLSRARVADLILVTDDPIHHLEGYPPAAQTGRRRPDSGGLAREVSRRHRHRERRAENDPRPDRRSDSGVRHQARRAVASERKGERNVFLKSAPCATSTSRSCR